MRMFNAYLPIMNVATLGPAAQPDAMAAPPSGRPTAGPANGACAARSEVLCPICGHRLRVPSGVVVGRIGRCRACHTLFPIPSQRSWLSWFT